MPIQELAEALAPGSVGQKDIEDLGLPLFEMATVTEIEKRTGSLADSVRKFVITDSPTWPDLLNVLRADITMATPATRAWSPTPQKRNWGTLTTVTWVSVERSARISGVIEAVQRQDDLLGRHLTVRFTRGHVNLSFTQDMAPEQEDARYEALEALVHAVRLARGDVEMLTKTPVPVSLPGLHDAYVKSGKPSRRTSPPTRTTGKPSTTSSPRNWAADMLCDHPIGRCA